MKAILLVSMLWTGSVMAAGELPFPFDGQDVAVVIADHFFTVGDLELEVEAKIYQDKVDPTNQWAKIWIRGTQGFVWDRIWTRNENGLLQDAVEISGLGGNFVIDLMHLDRAHMFLDGEFHTLNLKP